MRLSSSERSVDGQLSHHCMYPIDVEVQSREERRFDRRLSTWHSTNTDDSNCDPSHIEITTHEWTSAVSLTTAPHQVL